LVLISVSLHRVDSEREDHAGIITSRVIPVKRSCAHHQNNSSEQRGFVPARTTGRRPNNSLVNRLLNWLFGSGVAGAAEDPAVHFVSSRNGGSVPQSAHFGTAPGSAKGLELLRDVPATIEASLHHHRRLVRDWPAILDAVRDMEELRQMCQVWPC
jgi:hypothetical protein